MQDTFGNTTLVVALISLAGIPAIPLYAAIRPPCGSGLGTTALAGVAAGLLIPALPDVGRGLTSRLIPATVWREDRSALGALELLLCPAQDFVR